MAKKQAEKQYRAVVGVENSKTGLRFEPGEAVPADAFPSVVLEGWLARGILCEVKNGDRKDK